VGKIIVKFFKGIKYHQTKNEIKQNHFKMRDNTKEGKKNLGGTGASNLCDSGLGSQQKGETILKEIPVMLVPGQLAKRARSCLWGGTKRREKRGIKCTIFWEEKAVTEEKRKLFFFWSQGKAGKMGIG